MRKTAIAVALATVVTGFAANAQESNYDTYAAQAAYFQKHKTDKAGKAGAKKAERATAAGRGKVAASSALKAKAPKAASRTSKREKVTFSERGYIEVLPGGQGIDMSKTASIPAPKPGSGGKAAKTGKGPYGAIIARYAAAYGVPVSLAHAIIRIESNYRPNARGSAGEVGLMQIKPATARGMGYSGSIANLYHPETNIKYGMKYLGIAHRLGGGSICGTILKYNAGHGAKRMNPTSAKYCSQVKRHIGS